jgi:hypothetical protein
MEDDPQADECFVSIAAIRIFLSGHAQRHCTAQQDPGTPLH